MIDKLNSKLEDVRRQKEESAKLHKSLTKQLEQVKANFDAQTGAEQVLLQLIGEIQSKEASADETNKA